MLQLGLNHTLQADSIFSWRFDARNGDRWGGTLIADGLAHAPGDSVETPFGTYWLLMEQTFAVDLGAFGLHEGQVFVEWYWHSESGRFLPTRNGPGVVSGTAGLGSEQDAAWTGIGWALFGLGGALLVSGPVAATTGRLLNGGNGNDTFVGGLLNDTIDGGGGHDVVIYSGSMQQVEISRTGTDILVTARGDASAFDRFRNVEEFRFADATLHFGADATVAKVTRLYLASLGRSPDRAGLENWTAALDAGLPLRSAATGFLQSPEFTLRFGALSDADYVERLYLNVLGRSSDQPGKQGWLAALAQGQSRTDLLIGFSESQEHRLRTADLQANGILDYDDTMAFVARLYRSTLSRDPDLEGAKHWANTLRSGHLTPDSIVFGFTQSAEFQLRYGPVSDPIFVDLLYRNALGREPDLPGLEAWTSAMAAGMSRSQVVLGFSESLEHQMQMYARWADAGIIFIG